MAWQHRQHENCKHYDCWCGTCNRGGEQKDIDWDKTACGHWSKSNYDNQNDDDEY